MSGWPACRRSAILSLALVPLTVSTPCLSFGSLNLAALGGYEAWPARTEGAAFTAPAMIPAVTAAATAVSQIGRRVRDVLSRMRCFICVRLLSMSRGATRGLSCPGDGGDGGHAFASWRPPCLCRRSEGRD